jgi:hypothetical protein
LLGFRLKRLAGRALLLAVLVPVVLAFLALSLAAALAGWLAERRYRVPRLLHRTAKIALLTALELGALAMMAGRGFLAWAAEHGPAGLSRCRQAGATIRAGLGRRWTGFRLAVGRFQEIAEPYWEVSGGMALETLCGLLVGLLLVGMLLNPMDLKELALPLGIGGVVVVGALLGARLGLARLALQEPAESAREP